jgi:transcriptional regulator with PAS, ATPase and Fis domain
LSISSRDLNPPIVGSSTDVHELVCQIISLAPTDVSVLITGESGTGKELVARNLHHCSRRCRGPFVAVNCAALNPGVLESELFGHGRGAFTGAVASHAGLFEQAERGTLFLDEIGELPRYVQAKLLRVLQDRQVRRVGSNGMRRVDVRVVSATNRNLDEGVRDGSFRVDLLYRLNVVHLHVSPLRERPGDILDFIEFFYQNSRGMPAITGETREALLKYRWPGNVRELQNELERLGALHPHSKEITPRMLSSRIIGGGGEDPFDMRTLYDGPLPQAVGYLEENLLRKTLEKNNWNKSMSARKLGLSRQGLLKKIKRYGIIESKSGDSEDDR